MSTMYKLRHSNVNANAYAYVNASPL